MDRPELVAKLTPTKVDGFFDLVDLFAPFELPPVDSNGRAVLDLTGIIGLHIDAGEIGPALNGLDAEVIEVRIDSEGGNVWHGVALANYLRLHPARVEVEVMAMAASAASVVAMAGDTVTMHPGSMMMVHNGTAHADGLTAPDLRDLADLLDQININMADLYTGRAGGTRGQWLEVMAAETWFTGDEAVAAGLATASVQIGGRDPGEGDTTTGGDGSEVAASAGLDNAAGAADLRDVFGYRYNGRDEAPAPDMVIAALTDTTDTTDTDSDSDSGDGLEDGLEVDVDLSWADTPSAVLFAAAVTTRPILTAAVAAAMMGEQRQ